MPAKPSQVSKTRERKWLRCFSQSGTCIRALFVSTIAKITKTSRPARIVTITHFRYQENVCGFHTATGAPQHAHTAGKGLAFSSYVPNVNSAIGRTVYMRVETSAHGALSLCAITDEAPE